MWWNGAAALARIFLELVCGLNCVEHVLVPPRKFTCCTNGLSADGIVFYLSRKADRDVARKLPRIF